MRVALSLAAAALALPALGGEILLQGDDPLAVVASNPNRASMAAGETAQGGPDAGLPGDRWYYRISVTDVGKRFYATPDHISLLVDTTGARGELTIEVGVYMGTYGSRNGEVLWDGQKILDVNAYGRGNERVETLTHVVTPEPAVHELRIADRHGEGTYITIDAIRLSAEGELRLVDADGLAIELTSPSLPPDEAEAMAAELDGLANLAAFTDDTAWHATETFPVPTWDARAAFDGDPEDGDYWAGGTPAPHAIVVSYAEPISFDTNRILWMGENRAVVYGLEAWDADKERWNLVYHDPHNLRERPVYVFEPVTTTRIRFTMLELTGQQRVLMKAFQLYDRAGGGGQ